MKTYDKAYEGDVLEYFRGKADGYDEVDKQLYWCLSDDLLFHVMQTRILSQLPDGFSFMDAGGGTGRWTDRTLRARPASKGVLFDLSKEMSDKAREKAERGGMTERLQVIVGRLEDAPEVLAGQQFDLIFNFHNVLGFVQEPASVIRGLSTLLRPNGLFVSFVPNLYHAAYFNIMLGRMGEAEHARETNRAGFTSNMPRMNMFTPESMTRMYEAAGLSPELCTGFPSLIYPGMSETQLRGSTASIDQLLGDEPLYKRIYQMELWALEQPGIAARGNNLFVVGKKA